MATSHGLGELVDGVVEPAMALGAINVPAYYDVQYAVDRKENSNPLWGGGAIVHNHNIYPQGLAFCSRTEVQNRSNTTIAHRNNPAFQDFNGAGTFLTDDLAKSEPAHRSYLALKAKNAVEKEIFCLGVVVNGVKAKFTDTPGAFTVQAAGQTTVVPTKPVCAGDILIWEAPSTSSNATDIKKSGPSARREAQIRPLDPQYIHNRAVWIQTMYGKQAALIDQYREDRDGSRVMEPKDDYEAVLNIEQAMLLSAAVGASAVFRMYEAAMAALEYGQKGEKGAGLFPEIDPGSSDKEFANNVFTHFGLPPMNRNNPYKDVDSPDELAKKIEERTQSAVDGFVRRFGIVRESYYPLHEKQKMAKTVLGMALIDPDSLTASDSPVKAALQSNENLRHFGFIDQNHFHQVAKGQLFSGGKRIKRLHRHLAVAFPNMIQSTMQYYLEVDRRKLGMATQSVPAGKQVHMILGARR